MVFSIKQKADAPQLGGRGGTIGGTSWGPVLGMSRYKTPHDIWLRMKGLEEPVPQNSAMRRGIRLEPIVSGVTAGALGMSLKEPEVETVFWPDPYREYFSASVDRDAFSGWDYAGPVELKTMSTRGEWGECGPPEYRLQLQSYIWQRHLASQAVGGPSVDFGWLACVQASDDVFAMCRSDIDAEHAISIGAAKLHLHKFERDPVFKTEVIPYVEWWIKNYIEGDRPPPADGSSSSLEALRRHFRYEPEKRCDITPKMRSLVDELEAADRELSQQSRQQRECKARRDKIKAELIEAMDGNSRAVGDALSVSVKITRDSDLDRARLREERPEIFEEFKKLRNPSARVKILRATND